MLAVRPHIARRALDAGFDEHLSKPVEPETLEALICSRISAQA